MVNGCNHRTLPTLNINPSALQIISFPFQSKQPRAQELSRKNPAMPFLETFLFLVIAVTRWASAVTYQDLELNAIVYQRNYPDGNLQLEESEHGYPIKRFSFRGANPHDLSARASGFSSPETEIFGARDNCGANSIPEFRVVGGEEAIPGQFPYTVALMRYYSYGLRFNAGGSLIAKQWVLTAAHNLLDHECQPKPLESFVLYVGAHNVYNSSEPHRQTFTIKKAFTHTDYNCTTFENDIALIELDKPVVLGERVQLVCLGNSDPEPGQKAVLSGWGKLGDYLPPSDVLQGVTLPLVENDKCQQLYSKNLHAPVVTDTMICAGTRSPTIKDACTGDSGGPLVILNANGKAVQVGIVSWGIDCGTYPGVNTRVNRYLTWINRVLSTS